MWHLKRFSTYIRRRHCGKTTRLRSFFSEKCFLWWEGIRSFWCCRELLQLLLFNYPKAEKSSQPFCPFMEKRYLCIDNHQQANT